MILTIPYSHYYWVGGPPKLFPNSQIVELQPQGDGPRHWRLSLPDTMSLLSSGTCELLSKLLVSPLIMGNQLEKKMENEMETGIM